MLKRLRSRTPALRWPREGPSTRRQIFRLSPSHHRFFSSGFKRSQASRKSPCTLGIWLEIAAQADSLNPTRSSSCRFPFVYPRLFFTAVNFPGVHRGKTQRFADQGGAIGRRQGIHPADGDGLYLWVRPTGKAWLFRYKLLGNATTCRAILAIGVMLPPLDCQHTDRTGRPLSTR